MELGVTRATTRPNESPSAKEWVEPYSIGFEESEEDMEACRGYPFCVDSDKLVRSPGKVVYT